MAISIQCVCGKRFQVGGDSAGKRARCVGCGNSFVIQPASAGPAQKSRAQTGNSEPPLIQRAARARGRDGKWSGAAAWRAIALGVCFVAATVGAYFLGRSHGSSSATQQTNELLALARLDNQPSDKDR